MNDHEPIVTLRMASLLSGCSERLLRRLLRTGRLANRGTVRAPRVCLQDLPRR